MTKAFLQKDIAAARKAGADIVIVFPHWGVEYRAKPTTGQRNLAHMAIDAGADLVIGNHPHWVGGMELYKGKPVRAGQLRVRPDLVRADDGGDHAGSHVPRHVTGPGPHAPYLIMGKAQPNFMDPMGSGKVVMNQLWGASKGLLGW